MASSLSCYSPCMLRYPSISPFLMNYLVFHRAQFSSFCSSSGELAQKNYGLFVWFKDYLFFFSFQFVFLASYAVPFAHLFLSGPYLIQMVLLVSGTVVQVNLSLLSAYKLHDPLTYDTGKLVHESFFRSWFQFAQLPFCPCT